MGWCNGTEIFDKVLDAVVLNVQDEGIRFQIIWEIIEAFEDADWDCQMDSNWYDYPVVQRVFKNIHPDWFEEE